MFYLLFIPISAFLLYQVQQLRELKKHDQHLYQFCQLRRDALAYLNENYATLTRYDYIALRKLIESLNVTIHNYKQHKTALFDLRRFMRYLKEYKKFEKKSEEIKTENKDILALNNRMHLNVFHAFLAYTPFLKHEIILTLVIRLLMLIAYSGIKNIQILLNKLTEAKAIKDEFNNRYHVGC